MILPRTYFPLQNEDRFEHEGDVAAARERFLRERPRNLDFLLRKRYEWMNAWLKPGQRAVEFGAGSGFSRLFLRHDHLLLTDVERHPWIDEVADALDPPFADRSIDVAIVSHVLHHLASPLRFFERIHRQLKPDGLILIQDINTCFLTRLALRVTRHEGWSYHVDVFDRRTVANDPGDPWSANCAIPELLFRDGAEFERRVPGYRVEHNALNECLTFLASGGVVVQGPAPRLSEGLLNALDGVDRALIKLAPKVFAMGRSVVLRRIDRP